MNWSEAEKIICQVASLLSSNSTALIHTLAVSKVLKKIILDDCPLNIANVIKIIQDETSLDRQILISESAVLTADFGTVHEELIRIRDSWDEEESYSDALEKFGKACSLPGDCY